MEDPTAESQWCSMCLPLASSRRLPRFSYRIFCFSEAYGGGSTPRLPWSDADRVCRRLDGLVVKIRTVGEGWGWAPGLCPCAERKRRRERVSSGLSASVALTVEQGVSCEARYGSYPA